MRDACNEFREAWQHGEDPAPSHNSAPSNNSASSHHLSCPSCQLWVESLQRMRAALSSLTRHEAPAELAEAVALELSGDRTRRLRRALQSLVRRGAPALLDERVAAWIGRPQDAERSAPRAEALRALDVQQAPGVLERLLREELEEPERQRVERFSGTLPRLSAPPDLDERIGASVRRRALLRLVAGPLTALTAAGLIVWLTLRGGVTEPRAYRFQVVHATTLEQLDPTARALAESLGGGGPR